MAKALPEMTVDELDQETIRLKTEQPAKLRDRLIAVKSHRDAKVETERKRDRAKKLLAAMGYGPESIEELFQTKTDEELGDIVKHMEEFEDRIGVVVTPAPAEGYIEGKTVTVEK